MTTVEIRAIVEQADQIEDYLPRSEQWRGRELRSSVRRLAGYALRLENFLQSDLGKDGTPSRITGS